MAHVALEQAAQAEHQEVQEVLLAAQAEHQEVQAALLVERAAPVERLAELAEHLEVVLIRHGLAPRFTLKIKELQEMAALM
jgi:hypothetical protein